MATLYAFKFNNYYNRRVKKFDNLNDYPEPEYIETGTYCNFNPNDGINTEIVLGRPGNNNYYGDCDYFIYSDDNINITSRWFIIEQTRKMGQQYKVLLHRDVIADNWDKLLTSECFIEKANLTADNPLIFNKEDMTVNQIKKDQALLYDKTLTPWIIGYLMTKDSTGADTNWRQKLQSVEISASADPLWSINYADITQYIGNVNKKKVYSRLSYEVGGWVWLSETNYFQKYITGTVLNNNTNQQGIDWQGQAVNQDTPLQMISFYTHKSPYWDDLEVNMFTNYYLPQTVYLSQSLKNYTYIDNDDTISSLNNKVARQTVDGRTIYYRINVVEESEQSDRLYLENDPNKANYNIFMSLWDCVQNAATQANMRYTPPSHVSGQAYITRYYNYKYITLTPITVDSYQFKDTIRNVKETRDALYLMFAMPYSSTALKFASDIRNDLGSQVCVDVQVLPYFPRQEIIDTTKSDRIDRSQLTLGVDYDVIDKTYASINNPIDPIYLYWCPNVTFEVTDFEFSSINNVLSLPMQSELNPIKKKVNSQCDMYRLCSPNGNGQFEFNLEFNGTISSFNADCTYRPINPYVKISPLFNGLYGQDFNDYRGLICQGDFSIPLADSAWVQYENNNKNFQNIFNRQIENMEVTHKYDMIQSGIIATVGALSGGGLAGIATGNIGLGIAAGVVSAAGGAADLVIKQKLYNETLDYKKDMFGYELGNIRAVPQSLVKTGSLNPNNPLVPYVEYYTCTDVERRALVNKIAWNGMTLNILGQIQDYVNNAWSYNDIQDKGYIKAKLIRLEDGNEDFHNVNAIAEELNQGVYVK